MGDYKLNLGRKWLIGLEKDGRLSFWRKGKYPPAGQEAALPCASTNTVAEAESLLAHVGRQSRDGSGAYVLPGFAGTIDAVFEEGQVLQEIIDGKRSWRSHPGGEVKGIARRDDSFRER